MAASPVEEIKERLEAVEVIGQTVALRKAGRNFKGLCPFHTEKTPSFIVWPHTGTWHCFGCGSGGDLFQFVMRRDRSDFREALATLAQQAGVELPKRASRSPEEEEHHARLFGALQAATLFYHSMLKSNSGTVARQYLERRGLSTNTIDSYLLGAAPAQSGSLEKHLRSAGFLEADMEATGLIGRGDHGTYDWFRGRVLFPIRDSQGRVVGFGARALVEEVQPKYLNTSQTVLFDKGSLLYGLDRARAAIRADGRAVVVEGYMDVLALHQRGFLNTVATLGTAITERHLDQLKKLAPEIVLALDADQAGRLATERGIEVARAMTPDDVVPEIAVRETRSGLLKPLIRYRYARKTQIRVAQLPTGYDPDDLVREDSARWRQLVGGSLAVVDFALARLGERHDLKSAEGKAQAATDALGVIREVADPVEKAHYLQRLARMIGVDERVLAERLGRPVQVRRAETAPDPAISGNVLDEYTLALVLRLGSSALSRLQPEFLETVEGRALLAAMTDTVRDGGLPAESLGATEPWLDAAVARIQSSVEVWDAVDRETLEGWFEVSLLRLESRALFQRQRQLQALAGAEEEGESVRWLAELAGLTRRIQTVQRALGAPRRAGTPA